MPKQACRFIYYFPNVIDKISIFMNPSRVGYWMNRNTKVPSRFQIHHDKMAVVAGTY